MVPSHRLTAELPPRGALRLDRQTRIYLKKVNTVAAFVLRDISPFSKNKILFFSYNVLTISKRHTQQKRRNHF